MALRKKTSDAAPSAAARGTAQKKGRSGRTATTSSDADAKPNRLAQIKLVYRITRQRDPKVGLYSLLGFAAPLAVFVLLAIFIGPLALWLPLGVLVGLVVGLNIFSRRVQRTAYAEMEGKPGAAAGVVERMRGEWRLTPAVGVNRNSDVVHRIVCKAGVVVVAEGRGRGPRDLLAAEMKRVRRVVGDTPVHDIIIGNGDGEVPLPKLQSTLMRLPRTLRRRDIVTLDRKLKAVTAPTLPIPKGPIPRNIPRGGRIR
jgi:hypothetical protein